MTKKSWDEVQTEFKQARQKAALANIDESPATGDIVREQAAHATGGIPETVLTATEDRLRELYQLYETDTISYENFEMAKGWIFLRLSVHASQ